MIGNNHIGWHLPNLTPKAFLPGPQEKHFFLNRFQRKTCYTLQGSVRKKKREITLIFMLLLSLGYTLIESQNT